MFLGEPLGFFISSCFYFFMFLFLQMFLLLIAFVHFTFFSLCLSGTLFFCCYRECYGFEGGFFTLHSFLLLSRLPGGGSSALKIAGSKLRFHWGSKHRPSPSVCLNHTLFANNMISRELFINLSKHVDKLLVAKSFINLSKFFQKYYHLIDYF